MFLLSLAKDKNTVNCPEINLVCIYSFRVPDF